MKTKTSLRIVLVLSLLVAAVLILQARASNGEPAATAATAAAAASPAPKVTVAQVEQQNVVEHRELLGRVDAIETVEVRPRVSGHIQSVNLHPGQDVQQGDLLFTIDPRWYQAAFDLAQSTVNRAKVRVRIAERDAQRSNELLKNRAISVEEAETRTSLLDETRAELLAAEASLATAQLDLEHTQVRAPISGRINRAYVTSGNLISGAPGSATLLTTIVSNGDVYVYADVDEATLLTFNQINRAKDNTNKAAIPVTMQLTGETDYPHHGRIESSDNRLDPATGSLVLRMVFPNPDGKLVPGLAARVMLPISSAEPKLLVNERAIGTNQSQKFVLTVNDTNTVAYRTVKLGPIVNGKRIIRDGLTPADRIIINGLQRVSAGMTVTPETIDSVAVTQASNL
ncbi:efflux RND transporter periplasmic adaptor subunit [Phragmitibacter flavus]|uniref:Efflux RND transporter periplasmic adaptor subunit n=1 Tax=Phragmitibacter flavus TaxID=2576071 RepID=A0A5R8KAI0_9BACT|nr:efflux RND transporter periplasmic adaptor subunit [Phragmitibacter flavus]TLD69320.1 efflux RND transporter periplasmic adaptor subunit [Phragmitibacter flavus]